MAYHPRIEAAGLANFITTRSRNSRLWFVNNTPLENTCLGYAAKFAERYGVKLYALAIEGNHIQGTMLFPNKNRAAFMRDFNASIARAVPRYTPEYDGGRFWGRRYSNEFLPGEEDVLHYFFYTVLQPVSDGLVERISDYPFYNCFHDAIYGRKRTFRIINWTKYYEAKQKNSHTSVKNFEETVTLRYERLPGYEHLSQKEYARFMLRELELRRSEIVKKRREAKLGFAGRSKLLKTARGALPKSTKRSDLNSHRPRILSVCHIRRAEFRAWYFAIYEFFKRASKRYRNGELHVEFPDGTYRPFCSYSAPPKLTAA